MFIIILGTCLNTNAFNLTFCTQYNDSNNDGTKRDYTSATWQIWIPDVGNISLGNAFPLIDAGPDICGVTTVDVDDRFKYLLMTHPRTALVQQNATKPLQIPVPTLGAPFMKYCQIMLNGQEGDSVFNFSFIPVNCKFPTSAVPNQVQNRSSK
jgi:hypothetical protein